MEGNKRTESKGRGRAQNRWVWAAFAVILVLYVFSALRLKPIATFGFITDDGVYFSSAKALASGQGYILPSFPGHLASPKYPELYPLILAGVWKLDPHFPSNIVPAVGITLGFGCLALLITFLMLRRWPGMGDWPALAIVLLVGLSGQFLYLSPMILTDIPFMALLLGAAWLAERSLAREPGAGTAAGAGVLAGMSVGLRSLGIPVAAGIGLLLLLRRKFRRLFWFCVTGLPLTLLWSWPAVRAVLGLSAPGVVGDPTRSGWTQTVCYYSSYACEWAMGAPSLRAEGSAFLTNLKYAAQGPGALLTVPLVPAGKVSSLVLVILLSAAAYLGIARHVRRHGWGPLHAVLPLYLLVACVFPGYFEVDRYLLPLAPLLFAGLWLEGRHIWEAITGRLRRGCGRDERVAAWLLGLGALALAATVAVNYAYVLPRATGNLGASRAAIFTGERGAYDWIRQHTELGARVIAREDGAVYLFTGRSSIWPIATLTEAFYLHDHRYAEHDAAHLGDVARHVHASYWLTTPYEYLVDTAPDRALLRAREKKLLAAAPVVYRSADGLVVLYDTRCLWGTPAGGCTSEATGAGTSARAERGGEKPPRK